MSRKILTYMLLAIMLVISACAERNTSFQSDGNFTLLAQVPVVGDPCEIEIGNNHAYIALDQGGIGVINLENHQLTWYPEIMAADSSIVQLFKNRSLAVSPKSDRLFFSEIQSADTIYLMDNSDPDNMVWIHGITGGTRDIIHLATYDLETPRPGHILDIAYCLSNRICLLGYDGAQGTTPYSAFTSEGIQVSANVSGVAIDASHIFGAIQQRGLAILEKASGTLISELAVKGEAQHVVVQNDYAYIAARQGGLQIVDISDKANPVQVAEFIGTGYASDIAISGDTVAISSGGGGCYVFDVSNPTDPKMIQQITEGGYVNTLNMVDDTLIVGTRDNGIYFYKMNR